MSGSGTEASDQGSVMVVQNGKGQAASLCQQLPSRFPLLPAESVSTAKSAMQANNLLGAILDTQLPDGDPFTLVDALRQNTPGLPLLLVSSSHCAQALSRAHLASVPLVHRDSCQENLRAFATEVNTHSACIHRGIDDILEALVQSKRLSLRESQILRVATYGIPRSYIARRLGLSENTIKTQVRSLLDKTKRANLAELVWSVHNKALKTRSPSE
jgi:DNA-binding NarL/FixJ family response regulator